MESPSVTGKSKPRIADQRVSTKEQLRMDIEHVPRLMNETMRDAVKRVKEIIHHKVSEYQEMYEAWDRARAQVLKNNTLDSSNYTQLFERTRDLFWQEIRNDQIAKEYFTKAGFDFRHDDNRRAAFLKGVSKDITEKIKGEIIVSLDHIVEKKQDWKLALDADNLRFEFSVPNTYRENIQQRDPKLREFGKR